MKKRNLFLSLICSVVLTVALATFTIVGVVKNKGQKGDNNQSTNVSTNVSNTREDLNVDRDGSAELPYMIYDVDSFNHYVGNYGGEACYYELANDIDFAGVNFVTMFNQDKPFNSKIDGKGFALKNISINVNKDNFINFAFKSEADKGRYNAHIAIFGTIEDAEIVGLNIENIAINVADDVYEYVISAEFGVAYEDAVNEITVSTLASIAKNSTVSVNVSGTINADAYSIYSIGNNGTSKAEGFNAIGGVVAVANGTTVADSNVNVTVNTGKAIEGKNKNYFVGGVAGYIYNSTVQNVTVDLNVNSTFKQVIYVGGVAGYISNANIENAIVNLNVAETDGRKDVQKGDSINVENYTWVAGIASIISADETAKSTLSNITIKANVDIDVVYAGVVVEVWSKSTEKCVKFIDIVVDSNVNVLQAFGFARTVSACEFDLSKTEIDIENEAEYNIKLTGKVRLVGSDSDEVVASAFIFAPCGYSYKNVKVVVSGQIYAQLQNAEQLRSFGGENQEGLKVI